MGVNSLKDLKHEQLVRIIEQCSSKAKVLEYLGISKRNSQALKYLDWFIAEYQVSVAHFTKGIPLSGRYSAATISSYAHKSTCWADLMRLMDIRPIGSNIKTVKKLVERYQISVEHFDRGASKPRFGKRSHDQIFCEKSPAHRATVKRYMIEHSLLDYECRKCKNVGEWMGERLVLQLEHINGINDDNRIDNLCFLCPNCHTLTPTYAGRNVK